MKQLTLLFVIVLFSINSALAKNRLFSGGKSNYSIVVCDNASKSELTAAHELQDYLKQISGAELPIKHSAELSKKEPHIFIGYNANYGKKLGVAEPEDELISRSA